jgi:glycosyltransferase involved in cell wall biosynthesis
MNSLRIAAFGFRSLPPQKGSAGADKFALELYPRLAEKGHTIIAYNRLYKDNKPGNKIYQNVRLKYLRTIDKDGFDSLWHSCKATLHIILFNTADIVHIHNGGNSIWALFLRMFGKRVFISQDGIDWKRNKWSWYGKLFLYFSSYLTAKIPNSVIFDNIYSKELFEKKFNKQFNFIPYGSEVPFVENNNDILAKLNLKSKEYFLFVGRFIHDKGLHYLINAYENVQTTKKLVLVGGSPNPSEYEKSIRNTKDERIIFPGYIYGTDTNILIKNAFCYIQPSDVEGLSPVILTVMGLETPLICSDIKENIFVVEDTAITFQKSNPKDLTEKIVYSLLNPDKMQKLSKLAFLRAKEKFSWDSVVLQHIGIFSKKNY